jgi:hypothetical protein
MTKHEIASLASKLLGIFSVIQSFRYLQTFGMRVGFSNTDSASSELFFIYGFTLLAFVITLVIGLLLFFHSKRAAIMFVGKVDISDASEPIKTDNIQAIAFSVVGVILITISLPRIFKIIFMVWLAYRDSLPRSVVSTQIYIDIFVSLIELALGLWLVFGTSGIINIINKLRKN